jgi:hypothetical protein
VALLLRRRRIRLLRRHHLIQQIGVSEMIFDELLVGDDFR